MLRDLEPAFVPKIGKVTAGNSSGINDGSSAMVIMSADKAKELGIRPLARIKAVGRGACHPSVMGLSPVPAVKRLLADSGLSIADFELIEVNGSGIGLGHPVGSTGSRVMVTLLHAMKHRGKSLGLAILCGGGGVSMACALEML